MGMALDDDVLYAQRMEKWTNLINRMDILFVDARRVAEETDDLEKARELLRLVHHHGSVETNVRYLKPEREGLHAGELYRLNQIEIDVNEHEAEVRRLL